MRESRFCTSIGAGIAALSVTRIRRHVLLQDRQLAANPHSQAPKNMLTTGRAGDWTSWACDWEMEFALGAAIAGPNGSLICFMTAARSGGTNCCAVSRAEK